MELLQGLAVRFYRGVGDERQFFGPLSKMNILIGENNSGKSTFLDLPLLLLSEHYNDIRQVTIKETQRYQGKVSGVPEFFMGFDRAALETVTEKGIRQHHSEQEKLLMRRHRDKLFAALSIHDMIWINLASSQGRRILNSEGDDRFLQEPFIRNERNAFWSIMTAQSGGGDPRWIDESLNAIYSRLKETLVAPPIIKIPTKRAIKNTQKEYK